MVIRQRGATKLGCLVSLLLLVTVSYFGVNIGEVYVRYFRFQDAMEQEARFAGKVDDTDIKRRLAAFADSLDLPDDAGRIQVQRTDSSIQITSEWSERVELPLFVREFHFAPVVEQAR